MTVRIELASDEEVSARLGEKLLLGWTMLEENCPTGRCPLMLDPERDLKWSAATGQYIQTDINIETEATTTEDIVPTSSIVERVREELDQDERDLAQIAETRNQESALDLTQTKRMLLQNVASIQTELSRTPITTHTGIGDIERMTKLTKLLSETLCAIRNC